MSMFKREKRQWTAEPIIPPFRGATMTGGSSSPSVDNAMQVSAVWACIRLVSDVVSMMECHAYTMKNGVRVPIDDPPLLKNPSADASFGDWVAMLITSAMLRGNGLGRIVKRDALGYPMQIELWGPDDVSGGIRDGLPTYKVGTAEIPRDDVFHLRAYRMAGSPWGLSPVKYAALAINREAAIQQFAYGYFNDAPHPTSVLTSDQPVNQEQARTLKERLMATVIGREPLILGAGLQFKPLSVSPEESQFLATQRLGVAEICRIYGVPPEMVAAEAGNSMTYANVEQRGIDFLTYSIQPWLSRLETAISSLLPGGKHVRFDPNVLLRTDFHTRVNATAIAIASHQLLPDEARAMNDLPPFTDEEKALADLVPMTVSPSGRPLSLPGAAPAGVDALKPGSPAPVVDAAVTVKGVPTQ